MRKNLIRRKILVIVNVIWCSWKVVLIFFFSGCLGGKWRAVFPCFFPNPVVHQLWIAQLKGSYLMLLDQKKHNVRSLFSILLFSTKAYTFSSPEEILQLFWQKWKIQKYALQKYIPHHSLKTIKKWQILSYFLATNMQSL